MHAPTRTNTHKHIGQVGHTDVRRNVAQGGDLLLQCKTERFSQGFKQTWEFYRNRPEIFWSLADNLGTN